MSALLAIDAVEMNLCAEYGYSSRGFSKYPLVYQSNDYRSCLFLVYRQSERIENRLQNYRNHFTLFRSDTTIIVCRTETTLIHSDNDAIITYDVIMPSAAVCDRFRSKYKHWNVSFDKIDYTNKYPSFVGFSLVCSGEWWYFDRGVILNGLTGYEEDTSCESMFIYYELHIDYLLQLPSESNVISMPPVIKSLASIYKPNDCNDRTNNPILNNRQYSDGVSKADVTRTLQTLPQQPPPPSSSPPPSTPLLPTSLPISTSSVTTTTTTTFATTNMAQTVETTNDQSAIVANANVNMVTSAVNNVDVGAQKNLIYSRLLDQISIDPTAITTTTTPPITNTIGTSFEDGSQLPAFIYQVPANATMQSLGGVSNRTIGQNIQSKPTSAATTMVATSTPSTTVTSVNPTIPRLQSSSRPIRQVFISSLPSSVLPYMNGVARRTIQRNDAIAVPQVTSNAVMPSLYWFDKRSNELQMSKIDYFLPLNYTCPMTLAAARNRMGF